MEAPWGGPVALSVPSDHHHFVDQSSRLGAAWGVDVVVGLATGVDDSTVTVNPHGGGDPVRVPFDFLVAATGFAMPSVLPTPGETMSERAAHAREVSGGEHPLPTYLSTYLPTYLSTYLPPLTGRLCRL